MEGVATRSSRCSTPGRDGRLRSGFTPLHETLSSTPYPAPEEVVSESSPCQDTRSTGNQGCLTTGNCNSQIRVAVRVRPCPANDRSIIEVAGDRAIAIRKAAGTGGNEFLNSQKGRTEERLFDRVFGAEATQAEVYAWSCQPLVSSAVEEGRSATVLVYGATGAGKTHTMFGEREEAEQGLIYRAVRDVFATLARFSNGRKNDGSRLEVKVSFLELYNETVRDLLTEGGPMCKVLEDERRGFVKVTNLRDIVVQNAEEALKQLRIGCASRKVEATAANARSSRSHSVFSLSVERIDPAAIGPGNPIFQRKGAEPRRLHSRISLIDLAGSERATQTQNVGSALKDGAKINQSLLALANCIDALITRGRESSQTPRRKPPYRDSKLTLMLKSSFAGDGFVSMIANVHPGQDHFEDSNNTLEYAKRASVLKAPTVVRRETSGRALSLNALREQDASHSESPRASRTVSPHCRSRDLQTPAQADRRPPSTPFHTLGFEETDAPPPARSLPSHGAKPRLHIRIHAPVAGTEATGCGPPTFADSEEDSDSNSEGNHITTEEESLEEPPVQKQPSNRFMARGSSSRGSKESLHSDPELRPMATPRAPKRSSATSSRASFNTASDSPPCDALEAVDGEESMSEIPLSTCNTPRRAGSSEDEMLPKLSERRLVPPEMVGSRKKARSKSSTDGVLMKIIETLQAEKASLDERLSAMEKENVRLRKANLKKDRQLASLLSVSSKGG